MFLRRVSIDFGEEVLTSPFMVVKDVMETLCIAEQLNSQSADPNERGQRTSWANRYELAHNDQLAMDIFYIHFTTIDRHYYYYTTSMTTSSLKCLP